MVFITAEENGKLKEARGEKLTSKEKQEINQEVENFIKTRELIKDLESKNPKLYDAFSWENQNNDTNNI